MISPIPYLNSKVLTQPLSLQTKSFVNYTSKLINNQPIYVITVYKIQKKRENLTFSLLISKRTLFLDHFSCYTFRMPSLPPQQWLSIVIEELHHILVVA